MTTLVFLLEEPSARDLLVELLPSSLHIQYLVFEGKQDLEKQLVAKLRGWRRPNSAFVVLRDQDAADCHASKKKLNGLVELSGRTPTLVRVACRELESWFVGDWHAVAKAFERPDLEKQANKEAYRDPDRLTRPVEVLRKFLPEYQKRDGARRLGRVLNLEQNSSTSFKAFCTGVRRLADACGTLTG